MTDKVHREKMKRLEQIGKEWDARNPDACPRCKCRPGHGDAEDGSDHESFCELKDLNKEEHG